jgi:hypothetical protein
VRPFTVSDINNWPQAITSIGLAMCVAAIKKDYMMTDTFRKQYKPLTEDQKSWINSFKDMAQKLHDEFESASYTQNDSDKRMIALAKTNLEQSIMWAIKAIT